jgi:hypothetical protein
MTDLFLLFLGVAWLLALWPAAARARRATPLSTATRFKQGMRLIAPKAARAGRWVLMPRPSGASDRAARRTRMRVLRRRKQMFTSLLLAAPLTTVAGAVRGGEAWIAPLGVAAALAGYVAFLLVSKRRRRAANRARARARTPELDFTEPIYEQRRA